MARVLAVGVLIAATLTGVASPAGAALTGATFGETGTLTADGGVAEVSLRVACADGRIGFTVTLTRGSVSGVGRGAAQCNQAHDITVMIAGSTWYSGPSEPGEAHPPPGGGWSSTPGPVDACGHVIFQDPGGGEEDYRWCSEILLQSGRR